MTQSSVDFKSLVPLQATVFGLYEWVNGGEVEAWRVSLVSFDPEWLEWICPEFKRISLQVNDQQISFFRMNEEEMSVKVHRPKQ